MPRKTFRKKYIRRRRRPTRQRRGRPLNGMQRRALTTVTKKFTKVYDIVVLPGAGSAQVSVSMMGAANTTNPGLTTCMWNQN